MSALKVAGIVAILGSLLFLMVPFLTPGLYQLSPEERVNFVRAHQSTVVLQNILLSLAGFLVAGSLVGWSLQAQDTVPVLLNAAGSTLLILGAVFLALFFLQTTRNPASYYLAESMSLRGNAYFIFTIGAFLIYSILFLRSPIGNWLGYFAGAVSGLMLVGFFVIGGKDLPPQPFFLVSLAAGVVFLIS